MASFGASPPLYPPLITASEWKRRLQCRGTEWRTHWTHVALTVWRPTVKLLLLQTLCWNSFWSTARLSLQIIGLDQTCWYTWQASHPLASYAFINIKLALVALCSLYVPKIKNLSAIIFAFYSVCYSKWVELANRSRKFSARFGSRFLREQLRAAPSS